MRSSQKLIACLFIFLCIPTIAAAETMYVSDQLLITLRRGKSTEHKILKTLKTGAPLEILERVEGDEYVKVRLQSGEEGYVLSQYLTSDTPKPILISRLKKKVQEIQKQLAQGEAKRAEASQGLKAVQEKKTQNEAGLNGKINELNRALAKAKEELRIATEKYTTLVENSGMLVEITDERDRLKKENVKLGAEVRSLTEENNDLNSNQSVRWFLAGAAVLLFGWMIGKISRKKQRGLY